MAVWGEENTRGLGRECTDVTRLARAPVLTPSHAQTWAWRAARPHTAAAVGPAAPSVAPFKFRVWAKRFTAVIVLQNSPSQVGKGLPGAKKASQVPPGATPVQIGSTGLPAGVQGTHGGHRSPPSQGSCPPLTPKNVLHTLEGLFYFKNEQRRYSSHMKTLGGLFCFVLCVFGSGVGVGGWCLQFLRAVGSEIPRAPRASVPFNSREGLTALPSPTLQDSCHSAPLTAKREAPLSSRPFTVPSGVLHPGPLIVSLLSLQCWHMALMSPQIFSGDE